MVRRGRMSWGTGVQGCSPVSGDHRTTKREPTREPAAVAASGRRARQRSTTNVKRGLFTRARGQCATRLRGRNPEAHMPGATVLSCTDRRRSAPGEPCYHGLPEHRHTATHPLRRFPLFEGADSLSRGGLSPPDAALSLTLGEVRPRTSHLRFPPAPLCALRH